jgi:hypothetical protein
MTQRGRSSGDRDQKMHPLFVELYLSGDSDDPADAAGRQRGRRPRSRRSVRRKLLTRGS